MYTPLDENAFAGAFRAGDSRRYGIDLKANRTAIITAAVTLSKVGFPSFGPIHKTIANGRDCSSIKDYSQALILRILAKFIARRFRVDIDNRDRLVRGVIASLADSTPIYIVRRDISSFYESIPTQGLFDKITRDVFVPAVLRQHLECFFQTFCPAGTTGVPRGVCVSPILAELAMEKFDKTVRSLPGVYKYFRYSDDILIFSYLPTSEIEVKLPAILPLGMSFNPKKSFSTSLACEKKEMQATQSIEYLGYSYSVSDLCGEKDPRRVAVCISVRKLSKLKARIFRCFRSYQRDKNFGLLKDRLRFLSGNYVVQRQGVTTVKTSRLVKSGIYYNYRLCGLYAKSAVEPHHGNELKDLDGVYQSLLRPTCKIGSMFTAAQCQDLRGISFFKGFQLKLTVRFAPDRVAQMKRAWRNG